MLSQQKPGAPAQPEPGRALLQAYLPRTLIEHWARDPSGDATWGETLHGTLMHCDLSGFTAMSERLARLGKEGAELMAGVLNRFFDRMLEIAAGWGGLQMKFGGDAMLLYFDGDAHAQRAAACALEMQRAMPEFAGVEAGGERHRLRMRAGLHSGRFIAASTGHEETGVLHYLLLGPDVSRTAAVEAAGQLGRAVVSAECARQLEGVARLVSFGDVYRIRDVEEPARPGARIDITGAPSTVLRRYLMPPFAAPLARGREPHFAAEHRRVTAVFINVVGMSEMLARGEDAEALRQVSTYMQIVLDQLDRHGGFLGGSDAADHGDKLIVLFGAPVSSERDEENALRFVLDLDRDAIAAGLTLRHSIGVSTGFVFAGEIGARMRREYTVIGDSVNLAARLMAAAPPGAIYVASTTAGRAGLERAGGASSEFAFQRLKPMAVKGKTAKVQAYRLRSAGQRVAPSPRHPVIRLLGRDEELAAIVDLASESRARGVRFAFIHGEPGIGKSALIEEALSRLTASGWRSIAAYCQAHRARDVFSAWQAPLRTLFAISTEDDAPTAWSKIDAVIARLAPDEHEFAPLVAGLLAVPAEEGAMLRFLDARARRQHLASLLRAVLGAASAEAPIVLMFEDAHLCDAPSLELLREVTAGLAAPLLVCLTSRASMPPEAFADAIDTAVEVRELRSEDARLLAASLVDLDGDRLDALLKRAQGNPLFVQELALSGARESDMPETVNDVIVARLDRLPADERAVLRAAAVTGTAFNAAYVRALLSDRLDDTAIALALDALTQTGFTARLEAPDALAFTHPLAQEVVYDAMPFNQRRTLHATLARHIEDTAGGAIDAEAGVLLHHYDRAGDAPKTVVYAALSGDRAARAYANREAIDYYQRAMVALDVTGAPAPSDASVLLERIGQSLETQGRHSAASEALLDALTRWRGRKGNRRRRLLAVGASESAREAVLCRRIAVSCERSSSYDEALEWLDAALAALPSRSGRVGAEIFASKSVTLYRKGEYAEAIIWGRRALGAARRTTEPDVIAYAENMLAQSYMSEGSLREAVKHYNAAVRLYEQIGDTPGLAASHNNLGSCYQLMGLLDAARSHYEIALEADERVGDHIDMAIIHNNIGEILLIQGSYGDAMAYLDRVLEAHRAESELTAVAGLSYVNLCRCAMATGDLDSAVRHIRDGIRLLRRVGARGLLTEARMQLAELSAARGDFAAALRDSQQALKDAQASGDRLLEARGERIVGVARAASGAVDAAAIRIATSAGLARRIGASHEEARSLLALARLRVDAGGRPRTGGLRRAVAIFARMGAAPDLAESENLLKRLESAPS